jgi:hypothetical protein
LSRLRSRVRAPLASPMPYKHKRTCGCLVNSRLPVRGRRVAPAKNKEQRQRTIAIRLLFFVLCSLFSDMTACSSEVEHAPEARRAVGSKPTGRARQGVAQLAERRRAMPEAAGAEPASLTMRCQVSRVRCQVSEAFSTRDTLTLDTGYDVLQAVAQPSSAPARDAGGRRGGASQPDQWVASSNGKISALQADDPGSSPGRSTRCRSSSTGQSTRLRTERLRDRTLRAAPDAG